MKTSRKTILAIILFCGLGVAWGEGPIADMFVSVNCVDLHYLQTGSADRPLLLFLHGFPEYGGIWKRQLEELSDEYFCVAPDLRGYNLSDKPLAPTAYTIGVLVKDIRDMIKKLGYARAYVVGHDWGAIIAWFLADYHPDLVEKLVIINGPHPARYAHLLATNPRQAYASRYVFLLFANAYLPILRAGDYAILRELVFGTSLVPWSAADREELMRTWERPYALNAGINYYRMFTVNSFYYLARLRGITMPTLVLWGLQDQSLIPENTRGLDRYVRDLTVQTYEDASHWIIHEYPERITGEIRNFLQSD